MVISQIKALLRLTRFEISIVSAIGVFVAGILAGDLTTFESEFIIASMIVFATSSGAFALNDYLDYQIDLQNKRVDRPLLQSIITRRTALSIAVLGFLSAQALAFFLRPLPHILVVIGAPFFFLYSLGLKKIFILKNGIIAGAYSGIVVFTSLLTDSIIEPLISYFAVMGFTVGFAVEVMIDIADVQGDRSHGISTIPSSLGVKRASLLTAVLFSIISVLDPLPFFIQLDTRIYLDPIFLVLILGPALSYLGLSKVLLGNQTKDTIFRLKRNASFIMQIGSIAYLIGVLI